MVAVGDGKLGANNTVTVTRGNSTKGDFLAVTRGGNAGVREYTVEPAMTQCPGTGACGRFTGKTCLTTCTGAASVPSTTGTESAKSAAPTQDSVTAPVEPSAPAAPEQPTAPATTPEKPATAPVPPAAPDAAATTQAP